MANRLKEDEKNERIIRNLLKLSENRRCINCNSLGPQYVCTNFSTFVCTTCSGIHREFTHRVKSVSMAKFTPQEVSALQAGSNACAREVYLKELDHQRNALPDGSNIERLRDFIKHVYVDRKYTGERNLEKPVRTKMGETDDYRRRIDTHQVGSRSPPYDDIPERHYGDNRKHIDHKRSPANGAVVNDWRRENRFGNRSMSQDSSDGGFKNEGRSPDSQRDSDMSSSPIVRPVRDILGANVSPLRVIEPPKATGGRSKDSWPHGQRTASSSSLASLDANPSEIKVEASFIDFDPPPEPSTMPQTQQAASSVQMTASSGNDWANFDSVPAVKKYAEPLSSVESVLSELIFPAPTSGPSDSAGKSPSVLPYGGAPTPQLANVEGSVLTNASTGGQWPAMNPQRHFLLPGGIGQPISQPITPVISEFSSSKPWNSLVPNAGGSSGESILRVDKIEVENTVGNSFGYTIESSMDAKSDGRKALPEDLFSMNYSYAPSPVSGWYSGSPYPAAVPMQYNPPVALPYFHPVSRSLNPFDVGNEPSPVQAPTPTFLSVASLQGALPKTATPAGLLRTSNLEISFTQAPAYSSGSSFAGQGIAGSMAPRPQGQSGSTTNESGFASLNPTPQLGRPYPPHSVSSNFTSTGGNPFG